jgi:hypothetical protein
VVRTLYEIVQAHLDMIEEHRELSRAPSRILEGEEARRVAARFDEMMKEVYPNGIDAEELERNVERYQEDQDIAEAALELMAANDQQAAKIEELEDDRLRLEAELQQEREWNKYLRNLLKDRPWPKIDWN